MAAPTDATSSRNSSLATLVRIPMLSSLSMVPPVCPRPRPAIIGTFTPKEATRGARIKLILSPTPPVLCLSTDAAPSGKLSQSRTSPERTMALVRLAVSSEFIPLMQMAIIHAVIW